MKSSMQRGYVMFEVLISVLVISVGFIGLAGMQVGGLAAANDSLYRSKAVYLTYQLADRVRANIPGATAGNYNSLTGLGSDPGCVATGCTASQMAATDFAEWAAEVAAVLPSGAGAICVDSTPDDGTSAAPDCAPGPGAPLAVKVWWTESGVEHRFVTAFRP
jgi:type IV pilus assembly protein PilV